MNKKNTEKEIIFVIEEASEITQNDFDQLKEVFDFNKKRPFVHITHSNYYQNIKRGYYRIGNELLFFRSSWEAIYASFLNILLKIKAIQSWEYEPETFWFENIKRGVRSYTPDFRVVHINGDIEYHEVKGWMDSKSKTKIKRMKLYYPDIKLIVIGKRELSILKRKWNLKRITMEKPNGKKQ